MKREHEITEVPDQPDRLLFEAAESAFLNAGSQDTWYSKEQLMRLGMDEKDAEFIAVAPPQIILVLGNAKAVSELALSTLTGSEERFNEVLAAAEKRLIQRNTPQ